MKTTSGFLIAFVGATVSCSSSGSGPGGARQVANIPQLGAGSAYAESMIASPGGVAITAVTLSPSIGYEVITITPGGTVSTVTPSSDQILTYAALDAQSLYFDAGTAAASGTSDALYSVPIAGGTPTTLLTAPSGDTFRTFAISADTIYISDISGNGDPSTWVTSLYAVSKSSPQLGSPVYSAAAGQTIDNVYLDGTTLYWSETDRSADQGAATVRSATVQGVGGALTASTVGTLPSPASIYSLAATSGVAIVVNFVTSSGPADGGTTVTLYDASITISSGIYALVPGASQPQPVTTSPAIAVATTPGVVYYGDELGIEKATVDASGVSAPTTVAPGTYVTQMASDGVDSVYYMVQGKTALYKL
jgi:hypothetical protein